MHAEFVLLTALCPDLLSTVCALIPYKTAGTTVHPLCRHYMTTASHYKPQLLEWWLCRTLCAPTVSLELCSVQTMTSRPITNNSPPIIGEKGGGLSKCIRESTACG